MLFRNRHASSFDHIKDQTKGPLQKAMLLVLTVLLVLVATAVYSEPAMINNGDFHRVTRNLVDIPAFQLRSKFVDISPSLPVVTSTMGGFFQALSWAAVLFGQTSVDVKAYAYALVGALVLGICLSIQADTRNLFVSILTAAVAATFSFVFSSFYEEAIVLVVLAVLPYGVSQLAKGRTPLPFSIASAALIFAKAQMLIVAPFLFLILVKHLLAKCYPRRLQALSMTIILLSCLASVSVKAISDASTANAYNRLYNGVGWSVLNVKDWPAEEFGARHRYFYQNISGEADNIVKEPYRFPDATLIGTSFQPTGNAILASEVPFQVSALTRDLSFKKFLTILKNDDVLASYLVNVATVTIQSDYRLCYLRLEKVSHSMCKDQITFSFGFVYFGSLCIMIVLCVFYRNIIPVLFLLSLPLACVLGDGFYEYEKHMVAYFMLLPLSLVLLHHSSLRDCWIAATRCRTLLFGTP